MVLEQAVREQLSLRYGRAREYDRLTDLQRALLLDSDIQNHTSPSGAKTVEIRAIEQTQEGARLHLVDVFRYTFHRNYMSTSQHGRERLPHYQRALQTTMMQQTGMGKYRFALGDGSRVDVEFASLKDTE